MASSTSGEKPKPQAACVRCRQSKLKCTRPPGIAKCTRCQTIGAECIVPAFHVGRQKGVKNKRTGLEKAIYDIEKAITENKATESQRAEIKRLRQLVADDDAPAHATDTVTPIAHPFPAGHSSEDHFTLHDAENPLQVLAHASDMKGQINPLDPAASTPSTGKISSSSNDPLDLHRYFLPLRQKPDVGERLDPIDLGLVSLDEADYLITFFYANLAHTRWGLDPDVHTLSFVRERSAFLFTALLLASSRFVPSTATLARRLLTHRQFLVQQVIGERYRSVEIVLAFMLSIPWMHPLEHSADDDTGVFISIAMSIALDLSLNKIIVPSWTFGQDLLRQLPKADCVDAKRALVMDGFEDVPVESATAQRLLRRRERAWLALFVLERGVCLARGRTYCLPITPLVKYCDSWHNCPLADSRDGHLISMAVLRRDLDDLLAAVRSRCDNFKGTDVGSQVAQEIENMINNFFQNWFATWIPAIGEGSEGTLPPYVEIMVTHTRLSTYSGVINHPTAPLEVKQQLRASTLSSAVNVMRCAIQGESRLLSMPNNTVIMICFAAILALKLSSSARGTNRTLAPSVCNLVEETATVLERIGSTPAHRNGAAVIYGKYLREILRHAPGTEALYNSAATPTMHHEPTSPALGVNLPPQSTPTFAPAIPMTGPWSPAPPLQFSGMSQNGVDESITNALLDDPSMYGVTMDDMNSFQWNWQDFSEFSNGFGYQ